MELNNKISKFFLKPRPLLALGIYEKQETGLLLKGLLVLQPSQSNTQKLQHLQCERPEKGSIGECGPLGEGHKASHWRGDKTGISK